MKKLGWILIAAAVAGAAPVTYETLTKAQQDPIPGSPTARTISDGAIAR